MSRLLIDDGPGRGRSDLRFHLRSILHHHAQIDQSLLVQHRQHLRQDRLWDEEQQRALKAFFAKCKACGRQAVVAGIHEHGRKQQRREGGTECERIER